MKIKLLVLACASLVAASAHAESFFNVDLEIGFGGQISKGMGDGTWVQYDKKIEHKEKLYSPAFLAGLTGTVYSSGNLDYRYHADYVYFGQINASCTCVADSQYNAQAHVAATQGTIPFAGFGHTQGVVLTADVGYTYNGWRFGLEAGPWVYWATWHESRLDPQYPTENDLSHKTKPQVGYVAGVRVDRGHFGVSYRYYSAKQLWNPYPAMATATHMVMLTYKF